MRRLGAVATLDMSSMWLLAKYLHGRAKRMIQFLQMNKRREVGDHGNVVEGEIENSGGRWRRTNLLQIHKLREVLDLADLVVV